MSEPAPERASRRTRKRRPPVVSRRVGYAVSILINVVLLVLVLVEPGWRAFPFLTGDARAVVPWFVLSLLVGIVANVVWLAYDPLWLRSLGEAVTSALAVVVLGTTFAAFPFPVATDSDWETLLRVGLVVALVGAAIAVLVNLVMVVVHLVRGEPPTAATEASAAS